MNPESREMTAEEFAIWETRYGQEETVHFWGNTYQVVPAVVPTIFGDGRQVIFFQPLATRPHSYVIAGDSQWDLDDGGEWVDVVEEAIGLAFGEYDSESEGAEDEENPETEFPWPALDDSCGAVWGGLSEKED